MKLAEKPRRMRAQVPSKTGRLPLPYAQEDFLEAIKVQHPEWVDENGDCPACHEFVHRMAENFREVDYTWQD